MGNRRSSQGDVSSTGYSRQISYNTLGNVVTLFCQWLIIMIIPKITDFSEAGVFAVAVSVASIINQIGTFTLNQYQVADAYDRFSENDYSLTRIVTIIISMLCIFPISAIFGYGWDQIYVILAYSLYRSLINFAMLHQSALQIVDHLDFAGKVMVVEGIVSFSVFIGLYVVSGNLLLATLCMALLGGGINLGILLIGYRKYIGYPYRISLRGWDNIMPLLKIGVPLLISTLAPIVVTALSKLILEDEWGTEIMGIFSTLTSPTIIVPTLALAVFTPFIGMFSEISKAGNIGKLRRIYSKFMVILAVLCVICYLISRLFAESAFILIYGDEISEYVAYFHLLMISIFLYSAGICGITVLITKNQGTIAGSVSLLALVISTVIFLLCIPSGGIGGATWGLMFAYGLFGVMISLCVYLAPLRKI